MKKKINMSLSLNIKGCSGKESTEFQKHFKAVQFCAENNLSYPKETSDFFKGKIYGGNLEDYTYAACLKCIQDGIEVNIPIRGSKDFIKYIKVSEIPKEVDTIVITVE